MASSLAAATTVDNMEGVEHIPAAPMHNLHDVLGKASTPMTIKPHSNCSGAPTRPSPMTDPMDVDINAPDDPDDPFVDDPPITSALSPVPQKPVTFAPMSSSNLTPSPAPRKLSDILTVPALVTVMPKAALKPTHTVFHLFNVSCQGQQGSCESRLISAY